MKLLISWTVALLLAIGLGLLLRYNDGTVTILLPPHSFEIAANTAALALIGGFIGGYLLLRTVLHLIRMPHAIRDWRQARRKRLANDSLTASVVAFNEGRIEQFEVMAQRALAHPDTAGTASLLAARAAHGRGDTVARDRWLKALDSHPGLADARAMFRAEICLEQTQGEAAVLALDELSAKAGASAQAQRLRLRALDQAGRWTEQLQVAARLLRSGVLDEPGARAIRLRAYEELFEEASESSQQVQQLFRSLSRHDREDPGILVPAIEAFAHSGDHRRAVDMIDTLMSTRIEPRLLILFTRLNSIATGDRLGMAEGWLKRYPDNPLILATLGRLCLAEELWGKAETFLKRANELEPSPFTRLALAEMYDVLGRAPEASELYRSIARDQPGLSGGVQADAGSALLSR